MFTLIEGFDLYNGVDNATGVTSVWTNQSTGGGLLLVPGRWGGNALRMTDGQGNNAIIRRELGVASSGFAVGFAFAHGSLVNVGTQPIIWLYDGASVQLTIYISGDGSVSVARGATMLITSAPGILIDNQYVYIEMVGTLHQTAGHIELWINGTLIGTFDGDTANTANVTYDAIRLQAADASGSGRPSYFDDMYVYSVGVRVGERRVDALTPSADTSQKNFVPSTGADNYAMIDEMAVSTADYVDGSNVGDFDLYELPNFAIAPDAIDAVHVRVFANKTDAATRKIATVLDLGGAQYQSADMTLGSSVSGFDDIVRNTAPDGGAWDNDKFTALKIGVKVTA